MWFADDADFINVQQAVRAGAKASRSISCLCFPGRLKNAHRTYTLKNIRFITPDVAAVTMDYVLNGTTGANGETVPPRKGLYDWIVVQAERKMADQRCARIGAGACTGNGSGSVVARVPSQMQMRIPRLRRPSAAAAVREVAPSVRVARERRPCFALSLFLFGQFAVKHFCKAVGGHPR